MRRQEGAVVKGPASGDKAEMRCIAAAVAGFVAADPARKRTGSKLKAALTTCMTWALTHRLQPPTARLD